MAWIVALALCVQLACGGGSSNHPVQSRDLEPLPEPELEAFEPAVQAQLKQQQQHLAEALASDAEPTELADAFGELGRHYDVYELQAAATSSYRNAHRLAPDDYRWVYHLAVARQAAGELAEAEALFRRALEIQPGDLPAHVRLGEVLVDSHQPEAARQALKKALELDPECALAHYFLGLLEQGEGNTAAAVTHLETVLQLQPQASIVHYPLAQALRAEGRTEEARKMAARVGSEEVRLADPLMYALGDLRAGAAAHIRRAAKAHVDGYYEAARREYELAIAADGNNPEAHQGMGAMLVELGDLDGAVEHFTTALGLKPPNASHVYFNLAALEVARGNLEAGLRHYESVLDLDPQLTAAQFALAKTLADAGRFDEAIARYRGLLEQEPESVAARLNLGLALARTGELQQAKQVQREVLDLDVTPQQAAEALSHLASLEAQEGQFEQAERLYREAAELAPQRGGASFGLGNLLGRQGRYRDAVQAYRAALDADPNLAGAWLGEATAWVLMEEWANARGRLEAALEQLPENAELQQTLARLLVTCPDPSVRDTAQGSALANRVFEQTRSLEAAETVALALAAEGRAAEAVRWQEQIVTQLERAGMGPAAAAARAQLDLYRQQAASR